MHVSLKGGWLAAEVVAKKHYDWKTGETNRRMNLGRSREIPPGSQIHCSAYERGDEYASKLPKGVPPVERAPTSMAPFQVIGPADTTWYFPLDLPGTGDD